jgi:hypothetical protein
MRRCVKRMNSPCGAGLSRTAGMRCACLELAIFQLRPRCSSLFDLIGNDTASHYSFIGLPFVFSPFDGARRGSVQVGG